jgi:hypothetical protein
METLLCRTAPRAARLQRRAGASCGCGHCGAGAGARWAHLAKCLALCTAALDIELDVCALGQHTVFCTRRALEVTREATAAWHQLVAALRPRVAGGGGGADRLQVRTIEVVETVVGVL